jgi:hypothetical protein
MTEITFALFAARSYLKNKKNGQSFRVQTLVCAPTPAKRGVGSALKREL